MPSNEGQPYDDALRAVLKQWRVETPLPPRFQEEVWRRIERQAAHTPALALGRWLDQLRVWVNRPAFAAGWATLLLIAGVAAGTWHAREVTHRWDRQLAQRYVASVNPYAVEARER
jgi:hypothetical protein